MTEAGARSPRRPSPALATALSVVLPGAGHLYLGRRRTGWMLVAITVIVATPAVALIVALFVGTGARIAVDVSRPFLQHPNLLLGLLLLNVVLLAFRVAVMVDAYRLAAMYAGPPGRWRMAGAVALSAALIAATAAPHAWAGERNVALYDLLTHDFTADPGFGSAAPPTTAPPAATTTSTTTTPTTRPSSPVTSSTSTTSTSTTVATTTTTIPSFIDATDRITVALLGGDAGRGRTGIRTDTIIVVTVNTATGDTAMFSVPRNFQELPIPPEHPAYGIWDCGCLPGLANTIYPEGLARPEAFPGGPNGGINAVKTIVGHLLGLEIDYVAVVALDGFVELIDAIGGVDITVVKPVDDPGQVQPDGSVMDIFLPAGDYHFDGQMALAYARARQQDSDYYRMDRQRCLLEAVAEGLDALTLINRLPQVSEAVRASLVTDLPLSDLPDLFDLVDRVDTERVVSLRFVPDAPDLEGTGTSYVRRSETTGAYPVADVALIRERVRIAVEQPPEDAMISLDASSLDAVCSVP